jgi:hypothetical protein
MAICVVFLGPESFFPASDLISNPILLFDSTHKPCQVQVKKGVQRILLSCKKEVRIFLINNEYEFCMEMAIRGIFFDFDS